MLRPTSPLWGGRNSEAVSGGGESVMHAAILSVKILFVLRDNSSLIFDQ